MNEEKRIKEEEEKKKYPSLPPNYVSLVQLQERWNQRKQEEEERKKAQTESLDQKNLKPNKGVLKNSQNSRNREPFEKGHQVSAHRVNLSVKGQEIDQFGGAKGMENKINGEKSEGNEKERRYRVRKGLNGDGGNQRSFRSDKRSGLENEGIYGKDDCNSRKVKDSKVMHSVRKGLNGDGGNQKSLVSQKSFGLDSEEIYAKDDCDDRKLKDPKDKNEKVKLMERGVGVHSSASNESSLHEGKDGSEIPECGQEERVSEDFGTQMARNVRDLSLNDGRRGNVTPRIVTRGRKGQYRRYARFVPKEMQKRSDSKLVWVRKGEMSNDSGK